MNKDKAIFEPSPIDATILECAAVNHSPGEKPKALEVLDQHTRNFIAYAHHLIGEGGLDWVLEPEDIVEGALNHLMGGKPDEIDSLESWYQAIAFVCERYENLQRPTLLAHAGYWLGRVGLQWRFESDEILSEVYLKIRSSKETLPHQVSYWKTSIKHACIDKRKHPEKRVPQPRCDGDDYGVSDKPSPGIAADEHLDLRQELSRCMGRCLKRKDETFRKIVQMLCLGHPPREVAAELDQDVVWVRRQIENFRRCMGRCMEAGRE